MRTSSMVWRALAAARARNLAEAGEKPPVPGTPGATRRALLKGIAAAGMASALPRPAHAFAGGRVAIVGGGIAGLSALHHLIEAGVDARLYEARGRLGGRMFTPRTFDGGKPIEDGGQLVNSDHADIHALARTFGVGLVDRKADTHRTIVLSDGRPLAEDALAEGLRPIAAQIAADAARLDSDYAGAAPPIDRLSIKDYLGRHAALLRDPWVRGLLEMSSRTEYGAEPEDASALELIFNLPTVDGRHVEILGHSDERYVIEGGSGALIAAMAERHAGRIETGKRLDRIDPRGAGVRLTFLDGSSADADSVILAVPAPLTRTIAFGMPLPPAWRRFIAEMRLGRNEKLHVGTTARPWTAPMGHGGELWQTDTGPGFALGWDGGIGPADVPASVWTWFVGGGQPAALDAGDRVDLARRFAAAAESAIPGLAAAATGPVRRTAWYRDPLTLGAYSVFPPGQLTRNAALFWIESDDPAERQSAMAGRIVFAGEHLSDAYAGFMNGAAQTGRLAAAAVAGAA